MSDKFWFVWRVTGSVPNHRHLTKKDAKAEAERLSLANPGHAFYVLESCGYYLSTVSTQYKKHENEIDKDEWVFVRDRA